MISQLTVINIKCITLYGIMMFSAMTFGQPSQQLSQISPESINSLTQTMTLQAFALMAEKVLKNEVLVSTEDADTPVQIRKNNKMFDYSVLLTQLKQNGFTAYKSKTHIHFIQIRYARHSAIPVVEKNKTYSDDEYVTDYIKLEKACSVHVLATLRPLIPQDSHMGVSHNPEILIISDSYLNIQRIKAIIKQMEDEIDKPADCTAVSLKYKQA